MTTDETIEHVARAIWEKRRELARRSGLDLEAWGDGRLPRMNGIDEEARAAIDALAEIDPTR